MNSSCFPPTFEIKNSCFSHFFFGYYEIKTFRLMNFLNTAPLLVSVKQNVNFHYSNVGSEKARFHC